MTVNRVGSILSPFFTNGPVRNFDDVQRSDVAAFKRFFTRLLAAGVYIAPSAYEAMFVSLAHAKNDLERTVEIAYNALRQ